MFNATLKIIKEKKPLIHCITNPISINQCANAILALGARPIMAEHPYEVSEITKTADALLLNTGNITDTRIRSIGISTETAAENKIPFIVDAVGVACSELRKNFVLDITARYTPTVLKGNYSEIFALEDLNYRSEGVDSDSRLTVENVCKAAVSLAKRRGTTILASGKTDIVTDGSRIVLIKNGIASLSRITGTGCMLGAICACFLPFSDSLSAAINACTTLGICGELSETEPGYGSFYVNLINNLSTVSEETINKMIRTEELTFEES